VIAAGTKHVRHSDVQQHVDTVSRDRSTPTSSVATVTYGLRNDAILHGRHHHLHHHRHRQPPPARRQSSPLPPVQAAADPPARTHDAAASTTFNASISSAWEPSSSEYHQSPKVITIVDGTGVPRPRPNVKFLLNRQSVQTYEQFVRDVACALGKGTTSIVIDSQPGVRLFTVRGREVAGISDLFRDDDVFIGVGVGRKELSVFEVRQIFQELYPNSEYSEILVRKWMRTRGRNVRPRYAERPARRKDALPADVTQKPEETLETAAPNDEQLDETVQELAITVELENETSGSKPAEETAGSGRPEDVKSSRNVDAVYESRLTDSEPRLSQSLARPVRVQQSRRGGSEPRHGRSTLPPLTSTSSHHVQDVESPDPIARSRPRQRGRRQIRLPPLHAASAGGDAEPTRKPARKERPNGKAASGPTAASPDRDTARRRDGEKLSQRSPARHEDDVRRNGDTSKSAVDGQPQRDSPAVETDENFNIITDVPALDNDVKRTTARTKNTARSEAKGKGETAAISPSRSEKDKKRSRANDVKMKTKMERQVSRVDHVTSCYEEGKVLGDGNFAVVKQCRHRETGREYAMKVIDKSKMANKEDMIENEIAIMKQCNHVNIVRLYEEYETRHEIYLIMELVKV